MNSTPQPQMPFGVKLIPLTTHSDVRGNFTEIFRQEWLPELELCQWNVVNSVPGVLRGVHVHTTHSDYLIIASGKCTFGLYDCRGNSPTAALAARIDADTKNPVALVIPPGVAHGFYFHEPSIHIYGVSHYWDTSDELGCRYDDPGLGIKWPTTEPMLSERDQSLPCLGELLKQVQNKF